MPIVSMFFGIIIRMYYDEHNPPHMHAEYQSKRAVLDFREISSKVILAPRQPCDLSVNGSICTKRSFTMTGRSPGRVREIKPIDPLK